MYGAVVIDPPGLPPVDHEYFMLQSEFYFGQISSNADYTKIKDFAPDAVVFNGYFDQYAYSPIKVQHGQRIRIWVLDEGPSENSSFHVVGGIWDTVYKEGAYLLQPGPSAGGSQALDLQPAQGGFVEFACGGGPIHLRDPQVLERGQRSCRLHPGQLTDMAPGCRG